MMKPFWCSNQFAFFWEVVDDSNIFPTVLDPEEIDNWWESCAVFRLWSLSASACSKNVFLARFRVFSLFPAKTWIRDYSRIMTCI
jgi:hypothetical protein